VGPGTEAGISSYIRVPITPPLLRLMKGVWAPSASRDKKMIWTTCCLVFLGFLQVGEMTVPKDRSFDLWGSATLPWMTPNRLLFTIKQSKTDPFRREVNLYVGRTNSDTYPVAAVQTCRSLGPGPLFVFKDS
jgi:hypothetical protein